MSVAVGAGRDGPAGPLPSTGRMLARGLTRRCPRCGCGRLFTAWFTMAEHCPGCRYRFEREEGFFLGALVINFAITVVLLAVLMAVMIGILASGGSSSAVVPIVAIAVAETILVPVLFYPFSKTTWAAIDLALRRGEFPKRAGSNRG